MKKIVLLMASFFIVLQSGILYGYDDQVTHPAITGKAVSADVSNLNEYLKLSLGFSNGLDAHLPSDSTDPNRTILKLLTAGSTAEDHPMCQASNHFHNPLLPWNQSQMSDDTTPLAYAIRTACDSHIPFLGNYPYIYRKSNVTWATGYLSPSPDGNKYMFLSSETPLPINWDTARSNYYSALTDRDASTRDADFAATFTALGHVSHLIQDMAVPAHVRNDFQSHLEITNPNAPLLQRYNNPFEWYVKNHNDIVTGATVTPTFADIHLTDFWDTDRYNGSNPSTGTDIGLSEYTNANYFSTYTIPNNGTTPEHTFPYPHIGSANISGPNYQICSYQLLGGIASVSYVSRTNKGSCSSKTPRTADHFAVVSLMNLPGVSDINSISHVWLTDEVHEQYAKELIPRAVGYSAGLLNYFFRGNINLVDPDPDGSPGQFSIKNRSNENMSGTFRLYYDDSSGNRTQIASWPNMQIDANGTSAPVPAFQLPGNAKFEDSALMLVFQGTMGNEQGAVAGRVVQDQLGILWPQSYVYSIIDGGASVPQFTRIKANVRNKLPNLPIQAGALQAIARYKVIPNYAPDLSNYPPDGATMAATQYSYSTSALVDVASVNAPAAGGDINDHANDVTFDFSGSPIPAAITDLYLYVVFKGKIGNQENSVAMGRKDLMEPTHMVFWNLSDMSSIAYNNWTITDSSTTGFYNLTSGHHLYSYDLPVVSPLSNGKYPLTKLVELDNATTQKYFIKFLDENNNGTLADDLIYYQPESYTFTISFGNLNLWTVMNPAVTTAVPAGGYIRLIVLVERPSSNYVQIKWGNDVDENMIDHFDGVVNQADQNGVWQTPTPSETYRKMLAPDGQTRVPIIQHYSIGVVGACKPGVYDNLGNPLPCPYPDEEAIPVTSPPVDVSNILNFYTQ